MRRDEIIEEVRRTRARIEDETGGTLEGLLERYRNLEEQYRDRLVTLGPPSLVPPSPEPVVPAQAQSAEPRS